MTPEINTTSSANLPLALIALTLAILLGSQIGQANQSAKYLQFQTDTLDKQITNIQSADKQADQAIESRKGVVKQSGELQTQLQTLLNDVLDLAKDDKDAQEIIKKWNVQRAPASTDTSAPAAAAPAANTAPAAEPKKP